MPCIDIRGLSFAYPGGLPVLRGLNLSVGEGESLGLIGPNASGKSTLFRLLVGLLRGEGSIRVKGTLLSPDTQDEIRRQLGLVFQQSESQLFMPTVLEDVAFGLLARGVDADRAREISLDALDLVGLAELADRGPHRLSGGEMRRVAIATVLAMQPAVLLLDEPSLNLDPRSRCELIGLLGGLPMTRLIASHDLDLIWDLCDRVVVIGEGRLVADGLPDTILSDEKLLRAHGLDLPLSLRPRAPRSMTNEEDLIERAS